MVVIEMEDGGKIKLKLCPKQAPLTVANFEKLVNEHFYDGLIFYRVVSGFMIQGGDPSGSDSAGSGTRIHGEFRMNGVNNTLKHTRGTISMARAQDPNSATSHFFIVHQDSLYLDGFYAAFGKVIEGMDVVDRIASAQTDMNDRPLQEQKIKTIRIED